MALALVLALVAVVLTVLLRDVPKRAVASERASTATSSAGPLTRGESPVEPSREKARPLPATEVSKDEANPAPSGGEPEPGAASVPRAEEGSRSAPVPQPAPQAEQKARPQPETQPEPLAQPQAQAQSEPQAQPDPEAQPNPEAQPEPTPGPRTPTVGEGDWSRPTPREIENANAPRHYDLPAGAIMSLTMKSIGIYGAPVFDSVSPMALAKGVAHLPDTSLPWSDTPQRNVYLAGHRMGFRGTWSRMLFYNLDKLQKGDEVVLRDRRGRSYEYRVSETFLVDPDERWVTGQIRGKDMLTLQTCTPIPTFEKRLIVRANRI
jgi:sortase A